MTTSPRSLFNLMKRVSERITTKLKCGLLLVVPNGELHVPRDDTLLLVVARGVARELEDLGSEVLEDSSEVD